MLCLDSCLGGLRAEACTRCCPCHPQLMEAKVTEVDDNRRQTEAELAQGERGGMAAAALLQGLPGEGILAAAQGHQHACCCQPRVEPVLHRLLHTPSPQLWRGVA